MDDHTYENWVKIKATFESSGNIDNMFYREPVKLLKLEKILWTNSGIKKNDGTI